MKNFVKVAIAKLSSSEDIPVPRYMSEKAAGMDICAAVTEPIAIDSGEWKLIPTGLSVALPEGFEAQIRPRSGLALQHGVGLLNSPGTIDADYRGEIKIILVNHGKKPFTVKRGDRIAQMVVTSACRVQWEEAISLDETERSAGGFGHTER